MQEHKDQRSGQRENSNQDSALKPRGARGLSRTVGVVTLVIAAATAGLRVCKRPLDPTETIRHTDFFRKRKMHIINTVYLSAIEKHAYHSTLI